MHVHSPQQEVIVGTRVCVCACSNYELVFECNAWSGHKEVKMSNFSNIFYDKCFYVLYHLESFLSASLCEFTYLEYYFLICLQEKVAEMIGLVSLQAYTSYDSPTCPSQGLYEEFVCAVQGQKLNEGDNLRSSAKTH